MLFILDYRLPTTPPLDFSRIINDKEIPFVNLYKYRELKTLGTFSWGNSVVLLDFIEYGQTCIFGAYLSAPNMVKSGVPEKILQNATQTRWS